MLGFELYVSYLYFVYDIIIIIIIIIKTMHVITYNFQGPSIVTCHH